VTEPAVGEITVRRCLVRVVRRGGWSWGPDPQGLVRQALAALPDLLAAQFDEVLTGEGPDLEITDPVRLSVRLGRPSAGVGGGSSGFVIEPTAGSLPVPEPVPRGVAVAGSAGGSPFSSPAADDSAAGDSVVVGRGALDVASATPSVLFEELAVRDELALLLALLPDETLRGYVAALRGEVREPSPAVVAGFATELTRRWSLPPPPSQPQTYEALVALVSAGPGATLALTTSAPSVAAAPSVTAAPVERLPVARGREGAAAVVGETRVCSALPFLLVGPLARTGYLDAIGPALAGVDLLAETPLFAAALAYKVLGTLERGWRRTGEDGAAAVAFAGLAEAPDLGGFADRVRPALPVLDGVLALSLCRGHEPAEPLVITGVDGGLLLVDAQGTFPIAWAPDVAGLLPHWTACGRPPVLVCDGPLPTACLADLAAAGADLLTDARPLHGDPLSRLEWRTPLWTHGAPGKALAAALPGHAHRAAELVRSVFVARFAVPRAQDSPLERSVGLAASLSLGLIAWTLWRERETPDPVLALTRFADLEATIQYRPDVVRVRLPLGRRHTDLWRNGLLTDVPDVVWLDGRSLTFSGG
jgi:hypothetical protein